MDKSENAYKTIGEVAKILKFKENKKFSLSASKRSLKVIKNFKWDEILQVLGKLI